MGIFAPCFTLKLDRMTSARVIRVREKVKGGKSENKSANVGDLSQLAEMKAQVHQTVQVFIVCSLT